MQIVIDIDEETLQDLYDSRYVSPHIKDVFKSATPLPKGHGRLIDADVLMRLYRLEDATKYGNETAEQQTHSYDTMMMYEIAGMIDDAPTIIEADKAEKEVQDAK